MQATNQSDNIAALLDAGQKLGGSSTILQRADKGIPFVISTRDVEARVQSDILKLEDERGVQPRELRGKATLIDEASLIAHALRNKDADSALFADGINLRAVYDYNRPVTSADGSARSVSARWGRHTAIFTPALSPEWKTWIQGAGKMMAQTEFADFLEQNDRDIAGPTEARTDIPSPADLMTMALNLRVMVDDTLESQVNRTTGEYTLIAKNERKTTGSSKIPKEFDLLIPVYEGGPLVRLTCKFRMKKNGTAFAFGWVVPGADRLLRESYTELAKRVAQASGLPLFMGSPES